MMICTWLGRRVNKLLYDTIRNIRGGGKSIHVVCRKGMFSNMDIVVIKESVAEVFTSNLPIPILVRAL